MPKPTVIASEAGKNLANPSRVRLVHPPSIDRYRSIRRATAALCAPLEPEDLAVQPFEWVSPPKWHLAHTTWFFEAMILGRFRPGYAPFDPHSAFLFNSYYESLGPRAEKPRRGAYSRPTAAEVLRYRVRVDAAMEDWLDSCREMDSEPADLAELGLQHEQQHQELLLCDIKAILHQNPSRPAYRSGAEGGAQPGAAGGEAVGDAASGAASASGGNRDSGAGAWIPVAGGLREMGWGGGGFAFDNEGPRHTVYLGDCLVAGRPATNADYAGFIADGGYRRPELWLSDGWAVSRREGWEAPLYWERDDGTSGAWLEYGWRGLRPLDPAQPVRHVSYYEADAFARWRGARLPTEAEWEAAADSLGGRGSNWEWTASAYLPYPGYRAYPGALSEYNGKFMIDQMVLRGGSEATPPGHLRPTYRNFFPAATRWQFAGIRLARDP